MKVRTSDIAAELAPMVKRGAPADVVDAINTLAAALADGTTPLPSALRWPEPAVRALLLDALAARDERALSDQPVERWRPVLRATIEAIDAVEVMRDRLRAGHQEALAHGHVVAEGMDPEGVDAIWTPLARASLRAALLTTLASPTAARPRQNAVEASRWTLDRSAPASLAAQELWRQARASATAFALREHLARSREQPPLTSAEMPSREGGPSPRSERIRARIAQVERAFRTRDAAPISDLPNRIGPLWIVLDRPRQRAPEDHAQWRSAVLLVASAGLVNGRDVKVVFTDPQDSARGVGEGDARGASVFELTPEGTFEALLPLLDQALVRRPSDAMAWIRANVRGPLDGETDVAIVTSATDAHFESETTELARVALSAAQREAGVRLHLVRPGNDVDFPHPTAFDAFHFLSVPPVEV